MFSINTNNNALNALQSLQMTAAELSATQTAISTGKKVASASDSPAIYSISKTMEGQIAGLTAVSDSLNFGQSVLGVALSASSSISTALTSLRNVVTNGQQTGIDSTTINSQINQITNLITQYANAATFNGVNLLSTSANNSSITNQNLNIVQGVGGNVLTVTSALGASTDILSKLGLTNLSVTSSAYQLAFDNTGAIANQNTLTVVGSEDVNGTATAHTWTFEFNNGQGALVTVPTSSNTVVAVQTAATDSFATQITELSTALQSQGFASSINASGDLVFSGNGISAAPTQTFTGGTVTQVTGTSGAVSIVAGAITTMNTISAALGSNSDQVTGMQTFTSALQSAVTTGVGALTDADMASESAMLTALQTKQSLAIQSLSIANQQPQTLLTLFR
jgi:flagellin